MNGLKACLNKLKCLPLDKHANRIFPFVQGMKALLGSSCFETTS